ncbi:MAG TPA: M20/M25/M40 family metallo-hydrolase, partial [Tepiditoga sp.]|nr:M20/M25/M40 family metallo-hydrolase [Tepiditoga sp.]
IGVNSKEEAEKLVPIGTFGTYDSKFTDNGDFWISKAMDDRVCCAAMIQAAKEIKDPENTMIFAFTVQEEVGLVGASVAAYDYDVDYAFAIDVTAAADTPKANKRMQMKLGAGPCVKIKDAASVSDIEVVNILKETAKENKIPYQTEVLIYGGTNARAYQTTKNGIPSGTISIATRYIHSPNETVSKADVLNTTELIKALAMKKW